MEDGRIGVWDKIRYFSRAENWGDPDRIDPLLLLVLDQLRKYTAWPIVVHCAYETSGHAPRSYHYLGRAIDFHFKTDRPFPFQVERVLDFLRNTGISVIPGPIDRHLTVQLDTITGLGIYPDWEHPGFHLDTRGYRARWGRIGREYVIFGEALRYAREKFA